MQKMQSAAERERLTRRVNDHQGQDLSEEWAGKVRARGVGNLDSGNVSGHKRATCRRAAGSARTVNHRQLKRLTCIYIAAHQASGHLPIFQALDIPVRVADTASVPHPCQNRRKMGVTSGHSRPLRTAELGTCRLTPCVKRPSKPDRRGGRAALRIRCGAAGCRLARVAAARWRGLRPGSPGGGLIGRRRSVGAATMGAGCP